MPARDRLVEPVGWFAALLLTTLGVSLPANCQQQNPMPSASVIINVIATDKHNSSPADGLVTEDFEINDRGAVKITSFAHASTGAVRSISVWFVVQCPETHPRVSWVSNGSGFLRGKVEPLQPVLQQLGPQETVGVAHWCDDGKAGLDLLPTTDRTAPINSLNSILNAREIEVGTDAGENALHNVFLQMRDASRQANPGALPVIIFFFGDHSGMHHDMANDLLDQPRGPLPMVYCINNGAVSIQPLPLNNQYTQMHVVHFLSDQTGGRVLSSLRGDYAKELQQVVTELHSRYELSFATKNADDKRRELTVRFSKPSHEKGKSVELRVAPQFLALAPEAPLEETASPIITAVRSASSYKEIICDASGKYADGDSAKFRIYCAPDSLTWTALANGDRNAAVSLAIAAVSVQGSVSFERITQFMPQQSKAELAGGAKKAIIFGASYTVPKDAATIRFVLRDDDSGHLGSFDLPAKRIGPSGGATATTPATAAPATATTP